MHEAIEPPGISHTSHSISMTLEPQVAPQANALVRNKPPMGSSLLVWIPRKEYITVAKCILESFTLNPSPILQGVQDEDFFSTPERLSAASASDARPQSTRNPES